MVTAVAIIQVLASILIVVVVLIQGGENVDMAAAFGGSSQAAFGPRGAVTTLAKITWVLGAIFMATCIDAGDLGFQGLIGLRDAELPRPTPKRPQWLLHPPRNKEKLLIETPA